MDYYLAEQARALVYWCNPKYNAQWKNIETTATLIPVQAAMADANLQRFINNIDNQWMKTTLRDHYKRK